jgi:hypothetical protein
MSSERRLKEAFSKVKEDMETMKNEVAFLVKRIAKIEESMHKSSLELIKKEVGRMKK